MKWEGRQGSDNIEDRRGQRMSGGAKAGAGIGAGVLVVALIISLLGGDGQQVLQQAAQQQAQQQRQQPQQQQGARKDEELAQFVSVVLKDTEDVWNRLFPEQIGKRYTPPTLVLFNDKTESVCGFASSATGPFYCPGDRKVYIDLGFYEQLNRNFNVSGDFAMAYVVAHEVAHHVQNLLGYTDAMAQQRGRISQTAYNDLSVRLELQADFLAGVWAHHAQQMKGILESGDIEEAMNAAHAIGDDNIQQKTRGYVRPDSFTHGTSAQRMKWFKKGLVTGDLSQGDTFNAKNL